MKGGEPFGLRLPVKPSAVYHRSAHAGGVSVHILGGRVGNYVGSPLEGAAVDGRGEGVVHDEGHAVAVRHAGEFLDVQHLPAGIGDALAEEGLGIRPERCGYLLFRRIAVDKGALDAHFLERHAEKVEGASVNVGGADEMIACLADIKHGEKVGSLPRRGEHGAYAAFQIGYLFGHSVVGRVLEAGIKIAFRFQIEEFGHLLAGFVLECRALIDRQNARIPIAGVPSALHAERAEVEFFCFHIGVIVVVGMVFSILSPPVSRRACAAAGPRG